jgi:hypothetical protein
LPFCTCPWCWGLGTLDVAGLTVELLKSHGVPAVQAPLRAKLIVQSLGKTEVQQAILIYFGDLSMEVIESIGQHADTTLADA